ncbi:hypothetical protein TUM20903_09670 [Citrobacter koseri]|nr:hypothetical protein TUM13189_09380 [Citrobacter koseri]BDG88229.1 hypothetical protein TUM20903_09670 [Citrobacter koseri]
MRKTPKKPIKVKPLIWKTLVTADNENPETNKKQTLAEYFIDKKTINKNFTLVDSYYVEIYAMH